MTLGRVPGTDQRAHARHPFGTEARLVLPDGRAWVAHTLDIGEGGTAVVTDVNLLVGAALTIQLKLPAQNGGSTMFQARAKVANTILAPRDGGFRIGLQFEALDAAASAALKSYLP